MISSEAIRHAMRDAHGAETYRRFVVELLGSCQTRGRLRWWQEQLLAPVQAALGLEKVGFSEVTMMFRHCPVRWQDLQEDSVPIVYGTRKPASQEDLEVAGQQFPFAHERAYGPCWVEKATHRQVFFCTACRDAFRASGDQT